MLVENCQQTCRGDKDYYKLNNICATCYLHAWNSCFIFMIMRKTKNIRARVYATITVNNNNVVIKSQWLNNKLVDWLAATGDFSCG